MLLKERMHFIKGNSLKKIMKLLFRVFVIWKFVGLIFALYK